MRLHWPESLDSAGSAGTTKQHGKPEPSSRKKHHINPTNVLYASKWSSVQLFQLQSHSSTQAGHEKHVQGDDDEEMKRVADEIITKEHGTYQNPDSLSSDTPKMSTAAQMARRKIAQPKSRAGRSTTPTNTSSAPVSQNTFGQQQPQSSNLFSFGSNTTSSFPPTNPSQSFNFSIPTGSQSFTFGGAAQTHPAPVSNPFASMNGTSGQQDNAMMDDSNQNQNQNQNSQSNPFNFGGSAPSTNTNGFSFGQSSQSSSGGFGNGAFGQQNTKEQSNNTNPFGSLSPQPQTNGFGSTTGGLFGQGTQNNSSSVFGGSSTSAAPTFGGFGSTSSAAPSSIPQPAPTFKFGATTVTGSSASPEREEEPKRKKPSLGFGRSSSFSNDTTDAQPASASPAPAFNFGQPSTTAPAPESTPSKSLFNFGQSSSASQADASSTPKPAFHFGQSASKSQADTSATPKPAFNFGTPSQTPATSAQPASGGLFGSLSKPAESASSNAGDLFGRTSKPDKASKTSEETKPAEESEKPANPFSSLFGKPSGTGTESVTTPTRPPFNFGEGTSFTKPTFTTDTSNTNLDRTLPASTSTAKPPDLATSTDKMSQPSTAFSFSHSQPNAPSGGLFSPKLNDTPAPTNNFFNLNKPTPSADTTSTSTSSQNSSQIKPPNTFFGSASTLATHEDSAQSSTAKSATFNLHGQSPAPAQPSNYKSSLTADAGSTPKKKLFSASSTPAAMAQSAMSGFSSNNTTSAPVEPTPYKPTVPSSTAPKEAVTRAVSTEGPPHIPRNLDGNKYKSYDENFRLRSLNRHFKMEISRLDVNKHDVVNYVQNYLHHRKSIVDDIEYNVQQVAGIKRRATDVDDVEDNSSSKRSRPAAATFHTAATNNATGSQPRPAAASTGVFSSQSQPSTSSSSNIFSSSTTQPMPVSSSTGFFSSTTPAKSSATFSPSKTAPDSATSNLFRSMIPGATSNSETPSGTPTFTFGAAKSTTPPSSPPKSGAAQLPKFEVPKFGGTGNFMGAFAKSAAENTKKAEKEAREKRKAEEFDSDEDDEDAWNKKYEEEQRAKKAKIEAVAKGSTLGFVPAPSTSSSRSNSPFVSFGRQSRSPAPVQSIERDITPAEPLPSTGRSKDNAIELEDDGNDNSDESGDAGDDERDEQTADEGGVTADEAAATADDDQDEDHDDEEQDTQEPEEMGEPIPDLPAGESLFSRISGAKRPAEKKTDDKPILASPANNSFKPGIIFGNISNVTPEAPAFSPITPATKKTAAAPYTGNFTPRTSFQFTPTPATAPALGSSIFSGGGQLREGPIPGEGLFGSRPSTPSNADSSKPAPAFGSSLSSSTLAAAGKDNTYKPGSPIKFSGPTPAVEVTAATPSAEEQANIFGQPPKDTNTNGATPSVGFSFGGPHKTQPGLLAASVNSSRAPSPGLTSEAESVATDNTEDYSNEPQTNLTAIPARGEENETVIYESKAALSRVFTQADEDAGLLKGNQIVGWNKVGSGNAKVLKDNDTGKCRIVFRAEPGANVLLNIRLVKAAKYESHEVGKNGAVKFPVFTETGAQSWMIKVKTKDAADQMVKVLEENKRN